MGEPRYAVGIDLGTTHCAISTARLEHPVVRLLQVPQLIAPGEVAERPLLPSFTYLPAPGELSESDRTLPWGSSGHVVGEAARRLGAKVPGRLVASAKSWVCHGGVNRRAPILPWNSPDDEPHVSPFEAQVGYLAHLRQAWEARHPDAPLHEQDVVVTVPASFDEGARTLTTDAAEAAGLGPVRLLEEPQAAFYDYLGVHAGELDPRLAAAKLVLVVDVGGGTTDLTLLRVLPGEGPRTPAASDPSRPPEPSRPRIERIAVGGHLMLGGDNMDAALATYALQKAGIERPTDATLWSGLVQSARQAKERLLGAEAPEQAVISYVGRGSRLVGSTRSITLERAEVERVLLDGFLPLTGPDEVAQRAARAGLTTLGLPYATDAAIGRHICSFLRRHVHSATEAGARVLGGLPRPDLLLLNGGVFNAAAMIERLGKVLEGWYGEPVPLLEHTSLETAVAHGAVRSALARRGIGEVIGGGTARAYYVELESAQGKKQALCIAPRGMEEGASVGVPDRVLELVLDRLVAFPLHAYTGDRVDPPGALVDLGDEGETELEPLPPLETILRDRERSAGGRTVPVTLSATLGTTGALELYLVTVELPPRRWRLEFVLRTAPAAETTSAAPAALHVPPPPPDPRVADARRVLEKALSDKDPKLAKSLRRDLEKHLGPRAEWSVSTCRALGDAALELAPKRGGSDEHELNWLRVVGWCLRPGFGDPGDAARLDATWALRSEGLKKPTKANWSEWWIVWRRLAPGLSPERQQALHDDVRPWLWRSGKPPAGPAAHGPVEMMQMLATLERLPAADKRTIGELLIERASKLGSYWSLGRVGARVPLAADAEVVGPEVTEAWARTLLALDWSTAEGASFAAASLVAITGDPARDVSPSLRATVAERLAKAAAPGSWIEMVTRPTARSEGDAKRMFGESLPVGLRLT